MLGTLRGLLPELLLTQNSWVKKKHREAEATKSQKEPPQGRSAWCLDEAFLTACAKPVDCSPAFHTWELFFLHRFGFFERFEF